VLWRAAGTQGSVTIQLDTESNPPLRKFWRSYEINEDLPSGEPETLEPFHDLKDALQTELSLIPNMSADLQKIIQRKIVQVALHLTEILHIEYTTKSRGAFSVREFANSTLLILQDLGIDLDFLEIGETSDDDVTKQIEVPPEVLEDYSCAVHEGGGKDYNVPCYQDSINDKVKGMATTVMALLLCEVNVSEIKVSADTFNGNIDTAWSRHLLSLLNSDVHVATKPADLNMLLEHLKHLVHGHLASETKLPPECLGFSLRSVTVGFKVLFDKEAFTEHGKIFIMRKGRLSCEREFREHLHIDGETQNAIRFWTPGRSLKELPFPRPQQMVCLTSCVDWKLRSIASGFRVL
jgi:hypothetical protein